MKNLVSSFVDPQKDFKWSCEACGGAIESLGLLGTTEHGRCRACGLDCTRSANSAPAVQEEACCADCEAGFACTCEEPEPYANDWKPQP